MSGQNPLDVRNRHIKLVAPRKRSQLEIRFDILLNEMHIRNEFTAEYKFLEDRKFRADFCNTKLKLIVELQGGIWSGWQRGKRAGGGHNTPIKIASDMEKRNLATLNGWRILEYSSMDDLQKFRQDYPMFVSLLKSEETSRSK